MPQLRTAAAILEKNEQILDGMERGAISPKTAEQMSQCCKMPITLARLEMSYQKMLQGFGKTAPVPKSPVLRSVIGLPEEVRSTDGDTVRGMLPQK